MPSESLSPLTWYLYSPSPIFPTWKDSFCQNGCSWPRDDAQVAQILRVGVLVCHRLARGGRGLQAGCAVVTVWSHCLPAWHCTGAPEVPARVSVCFWASPGLCSCLLHFLQPVRKENTCCETCSKKEVKTFLGIGITELAKSLQFNSLHCICYVE